VVGCVDGVLDTKLRALPCDPSQFRNTTVRCLAARGADEALPNAVEDTPWVIALKIGAAALGTHAHRFAGIIGKTSGIAFFAPPYGHTLFL
jgi:hypothetical protein